MNENIANDKAWVFYGNIRSLEDLKSFGGKTWYLKQHYKGQKYIYYKYICSICKKEKVSTMMKIMKPYEEFTEIPVFIKGTHTVNCTNLQLSKNESSTQSILNIIKNYNITKPYFIKKKLQEHNINFSEKKISRHLYYIKNKEKKEITTHQLIYICKNLQEKNSSLIAFHENIGQEIKFIFMHSFLFKYAERIQNIHVDTTYRLNDQNHPVFIWGYTDNIYRFFLLAIGSASDETADTFNWFYKKIKETANHLHHNLAPKFLISDAAPSISAFFLKNGSLEKHIICWAHVWRNIHKLFATQPKDILKELSKDIHILQLSSSEQQFNIGKSLFLKKYDNFLTLDTALEIFTKNYLNKNNTWYEGVSIFTPSTNNSLESFNKILKDRYFNWNKKSYPDLFAAFEEILNDLACKIDTNPPNFISVIYDKNEYYNDNDFTFDFLMNTELENHYLILSINEFIDTEVILNIKRNILINNYDNFKIFSKIVNSFPVLKASKTILSFADVSCSCYNFLKKKACKHVLKYLNSNKKGNLVDQILLKNKPSKGRPKSIPRGASMKKE